MQNRFPKVLIHYFNELPEFISQLRNSFGHPAELIGYTLLKNPKFTAKTTYRKNFLDSICTIYNDVYSELNFIPLHILAKYYPFSDINGMAAHYHQFSLMIFCKEAYTFFSNIHFSENSFSFYNEALVCEIKDFHQKTDFILRKLNQNLIFNINLNTNNEVERVHIEHKVKNVCDCSRCLFNKFKITDSTKALKKDKIEVNDKLLQAYIHVHLGNFKSAFDLYQEIISLARSQKKYISYFIAKYNEKHLAKLMRWDFSWRANKGSEDFDEDIDCMEEAIRLKSFTDYDLLVYICRSEFFDYPFQKAHDLLNKIIEQYDSQLTGGWSSNSHVWELIDTFAQVESFLKANFIIYDQYSNFTKLFLIVAEGLFASHAISKAQDSRFTQFDDFWLMRFIRYGDAEQIRKIASKYRLQEIVYVPSGDDDCDYLAAFNNLIQSKKELMENPSLYIDEANGSIMEDIEKYIINTINIVAYLSLPKRETNVFAKAILEVIEIGMRNTYSFSKTIEFFIRNKGKLFEPRIKVSFFGALVNNSLECNRGILDSVVDIFTKTDVKTIPSELLKKLTAKVFDKCNICERKHDVAVLMNLYKLLNERAKKNISEKIFALYTSSHNFDLFYMAAMYEVIHVSSNEVLEFVREFKPPTPRPFGSFFDNPYFTRNSFAEQLINICFKYDVDTTTIEFKAISALHPYYKWLLDMESFDYSRFNPEWVLLYKTTYYYKAMSKSPKLIQGLKKHLEKKRHEGIEFVLLKIVCFL